MMNAIVHARYGSADALCVREIEAPVPADDEVLVRVRAAAVNPVDWYGMTGRPYVGRIQSGLGKPKDERIGVDFAGTVEAVGASVVRYKAGDDVFGGRTGAFAEYVQVREERGVAPKPANLSFEEAAAVPVAGLTALQGLRDKGQLQPGQKVLINGASGGVGTFAVQIAKSMGAEVTGICSTAKVELTRSLGADHVIDYTREDFARRDERYDLMLDIAGNRSWRECTRVLTREATIVVVGGSKKNRWTGPIGHVLGMKLASLGRKRRVVAFIADLNREDLGALGKLFEDGRLTPVIDRRYELSEVPDALRYLEEGHAKGKIVIAV
jgi:NADPH:quinone reductase-like Zn-dependent oxidoreductase